MFGRGDVVKDAVSDEYSRKTEEDEKIIRDDVAPWRRKWSTTARLGKCVAAQSVLCTGYSPTRINQPYGDRLKLVPYNLSKIVIHSYLVPLVPYSRILSLLGLLEAVIKL